MNRQRADTLVGLLVAVGPPRAYARGEISDDEFDRRRNRLERTE